MRDAQAAIDGSRHCRGEDISAGAAHEAGRLGVDVCDGAGMGLQGRQRDHVLSHSRDAERREHSLESARQLMRALWPRAGW